MIVPTTCPHRCTHVPGVIHTLARRTYLVEASNPLSQLRTMSTSASLLSSLAVLGGWGHQRVWYGTPRFRWVSGHVINDADTSGYLLFG